MTLATWPTGVNYTPDMSSIGELKRSLDPIKTEMEGGNIRLRRRPGDDVGLLSQVVRIRRTDYENLRAWVAGTLSGGTARFRLKVMLGSTTFVEKVCQFESPPTYRAVGSAAVDMKMSLRVYGV